MPTIVTDSITHGERVMKLSYYKQINLIQEGQENYANHSRISRSDTSPIEFETGFTKPVSESVGGGMTPFSSAGRIISDSITHHHHHHHHRCEVLNVVL